MSDRGRQFLQHPRTGWEMSQNILCAPLISGHHTSPKPGCSTAFGCPLLMHEVSVGFQTNLPYTSGVAKNVLSMRLPTGELFFLSLAQQH